MMTLLNSKKGQFRNYFAVIVFLFGFGILSIIGYLLFDGFVDGLTDAGALESEGSQKAVVGFTRAMNLFDYITVILMVILIIGIGLTSYNLATPPAFFIVTFIMAAFLGAVSYFFNYLFAQTVSQDVFLTVTNHFPLTIIVCTNLHWVMLITIAVGSITLYAKRDKGQYA